MKLTPRLQTIADSINQCKTLADIGTDHAHLPIYLVKAEKVQRAIATDINKGPIDIARSRISQNKLDNRIETRQGSGLATLMPNEADTIVIAGMGGMLIAEILEQGRTVAAAAKVLILQPMQDSGKLRKYLLGNGYEIFDEELAKEDSKLYEILWVSYTGKCREPEGLLEIGPRIIEKKHPLTLELVEKKITELKNVLGILKENDTEGSKKREQECRELLNYYDEVKKWVQ